jgi:hypothetical protein
MMSAGESELIASIARHISLQVAPVERVYHEKVSDEFHIDIHHVPPAWNRPFHALITSGMSALPMHTGTDATEWRFAELCILLEPSWRLAPDALEDERWYWPVRLLKILARYPRDNNTWLGYGHSVATANPPTPFAEDTHLCACVLLPPMSLGIEFSRMHRDDGADTYFWAVVPIYEDELIFKMYKGVDALMDALDTAGITDVVSRDRASALGSRTTRGWWPFETA